LAISPENCTVGLSATTTEGCTFGIVVAFVPPATYVIFDLVPRLMAGLAITNEKKAYIIKVDITKIRSPRQMKFLKL
jgi:hypothetical protein